MVCASMKCRCRRPLNAPLEGPTVLVPCHLPQHRLRGRVSFTQIVEDGAGSRLHAIHSPCLGEPFGARDDVGRVLGEREATPFRAFGEKLNAGHSDALATCPPVRRPYIISSV